MAAAALLANTAVFSRMTLHVQAVGVQLNDKGAIKVDEVSATGGAEHAGTLTWVYSQARRAVVFHAAQLCRKAHCKSRLFLLMSL
jgi:hypothetical protein